jgi:tripartite-type tricarboxylate transporter receptor subunit TctC
VRTAAALLIGASVAAASTAHAAENRAASGENYPSKPVRFISPFSAGGGTDVVARALAQRMSEAIGRPFVVDNRGGAEGVIGTDLGAKAPPDGYTLLVANLVTFCLPPQPAQGALRSTEGFCTHYANNCIVDRARRASECRSTYGKRARRVG